MPPLTTQKNTMASTNPVQNVTTQGTVTPAGIVNFNPNTGARLAKGESVIVNQGGNTYGSTPYKDQSLTVLSSDKTKDIINNNNTFTQLQNKGLTTDTSNPNNPVTTYADKTVYTPQVTDTSIEDASIEANYAKMKENTDAMTASAISTIQQRYAQLKEQQKKINESTLGATTNALIQSGAAQHDVFSDDAIKLRMEDGANKIKELENEENDLINAAKAAQLAGNNKILEQKNTEIQKIRDSKIKATEEINKTLLEASKKAQETAIAVQKDNAIANIFSSGITDPAQILKTLNSQGYNVTSKEVADFLKTSGIEDINKIALEASKNGAPLDVLQKIGQARTPQEAIQFAGEYTQTQKDPLDEAYKKAQIAKIYSDINETKVASSFGGDPANLVAYAQQYAADGKIPTGLPKGTFGIVAQVAKELPKQNGQIIDLNTGVTPTGDTTLSTAMASLSSVVDLAKQLKELDKKRVGGVVSGTVGKIFGSADQQKYVDLRGQIIDLLSRARSGAALTTSEEKRYSNMLPSRWSEPLGLGVNSDVKIDNFINNITSDLDNKAKAKGWAIYGVSKVDTPAGTKTVGETLVLPNGVSGRVNADGTVTIIQ